HPFPTRRSSDLRPKKLSQARSRLPPPNRGTPMFATILHANDGSEHAFKALLMALDLAKQSGAALHMVSVEEISYMPEYIEEVREEKATAARRFHAVLQR